MPVNAPGSTPRWRMGKPLMTRRGRVVVLAAACLVAVTIALVQRQTSASEESPAVETKPQLAAAQPAAASKATAARPAAKKPAATARPAANARPASSATTLPVPAKSDVTTVVTAPAPRQEAADVVTISGCLEQDDEQFRLKDTTGEDAPKGRSWRSGFLRKSASTIDVVDQAGRHHLQTYVGQRVNVTGTLVDKEMQVRSVRIVAISCEEKSA